MQISVFMSCCCTSAWHTGLQSDGGDVDRCTQPPGIAGSVAQSVPQEVDLSQLSSWGESWPLEAAGTEKAEVYQWHCHVSGTLKFPDDGGCAEAVGREFWLGEGVLVSAWDGSALCHLLKSSQMDPLPGAQAAFSMSCVRGLLGSL